MKLPDLSTLTSGRGPATSIPKSVFDRGFSRPDDRFIPVRAEDIAHSVARDKETFGPDADRLLAVAKAITEVIEQETTAFERKLAQEYSLFNPDRDTVAVEEDQAGDSPPAETVMAHIEHLLQKANFEHLTEGQISAALRAANTHGLRVKLDLSQIDDVSVWARGSGVVEVQKRTWRRPFRGVTVEIPAFKRLAIVARFSEDPAIYVKLFKEIPIRDLEALLPHARVTMSLKDAALMMGSGAGAGWSLVTKLATTGLAAAGQILWVIAAPLAGLSWRTFRAYRRARKDRDSQRTTHLYFQNLGNNASVVHLLSSMIAQEEIKEALLIYAFSHAANRVGSIERCADPKVLDQRVQDYLESKFGVTVNFDMPDAMETMDRLALWEDRNTLLTVPFKEAKDILQSHWTSRQSISYHWGTTRDGGREDDAKVELAG